MTTGLIPALVLVLPILTLSLSTMRVSEVWKSGFDVFILLLTQCVWTPFLSADIWPIIMASDKYDFAHAELQVYFH